jgi:hypothetical protein
VRLWPLSCIFLGQATIFMRPVRTRHQEDGIEELHVSGGGTHPVMAVQEEASSMAALLVDGPALVATTPGRSGHAGPG